MSFWVATRSTTDLDAYDFTARESACLGSDSTQALMGGVGMAAAIAALEDWSSKALLWSTTQFISRGLLHDELQLQMMQVGGGRNIVQCQIQLKRGEEILQHTAAALGRRKGRADEQFARLPSVPPPEMCPLVEDNPHMKLGNLIDQFEFRSALRNAEAGLNYVWIRPKFDTEITAGLLALVSDFFLGGHPRTQRGISLDNTFRLCALRSTNWILSATQFVGFQNGSVHGTHHQFAEDGTLLSLSSQTGLLSQ